MTTLKIDEDKFKKIQAMSDEDSKFPDGFHAVGEFDTYLATIIMKWTKLYSMQRCIVENLKIDIDNLYGEKFEFYKFGTVNGVPCRTASKFRWDSIKEIESQIKRDVDYVTLLRVFNTQDEYLNFIKDSLDIVKSHRFTIKNYLEFKKIEITNF